METWKDIVAEMREVSGDEAVSEIVITKRDWLTLAGRIESACKTLEDVLIIEQEENAKLRRALEPVINVNADKILNSNVDATTLLTSIVKDAQAIMKEGVE